MEYGGSGKLFVPQDIQRPRLGRRVGICDHPSVAIVADYDLECAQRPQRNELRIDHDGIVENKSTHKWIVHISVAVLVAAWLAPTLGLFVSSFRTRDQIIGSGWWAALFTTQQNEVLRAADPDDFRVADGDVFTVSGNLFGEGPQRRLPLGHLVASD